MNCAGQCFIFYILRELISFAFKFQLIVFSIKIIFLFEMINEKAVDFFGETIVENDDVLPLLDDEYREELEQQYALFILN